MRRRSVLHPRTLAAGVLALAAASLLGCHGSREGVPASWQRVELAHAFVLRFPADLVEKEVSPMASSSQVWTWETDRMSVSVDFGETSNALDAPDLPFERTLRREETIIGGQPAVFRAAAVSKDPEQPERRPHTLLAVHFASVPGVPPRYPVPRALSVFVDCQDAPACADGEMVLRSIVFSASAVRSDAAAPASGAAR